MARPRQDGISRETGLLAEWPEKGPAELWRVPLGNGFSSVSVVGERAFTLFGTEEGEFAAAFSVADGKTALENPPERSLEERLLRRRAPGNAHGRLRPGLCLERQRGPAMSRCGRWPCGLGLRSPGEIRRQTARVRFCRLAGRDGRYARVVAGAGKGKSLVAFDKADGKVLWTALDDRIGYSTPARSRSTA